MRDQGFGGCVLCQDQMVALTVRRFYGGRVRRCSDGAGCCQGPGLAIYFLMGGGDQPSFFNNF